MAKVTLSQPYMFTGYIFSDWTRTGLTSNTVTYEANGQKLTLTGAFVPGYAGLFGTIIDATMSEAGKELWTATGLSLDAGVLNGMKSVHELFPRLFEGDDSIAGSSGGDALVGYAGADNIRAGAGDDTIIGGDGNDVIDGGAGFDIAYFGGAVGDYDITHTASGYTVARKGGAEGTDTVTNVERLSFSDKMLATDIDPDGHSGQVLRLYRAAFDRMPDDPGLRYWIMQADKGLSLEKMAADFVKSTEFKGMYPSTLTNTELVKSFYQHVLHRAPDAGGLEFWSGKLDAHAATTEQVLVAISESPENYEASVKLIAAGVLLDNPLIF